MTSAAWNADSYSHSLMTAMLATTTAKKLLSPMPGAMTNGLLAKNAMQIVPIAEAMQVARNTPFHSGVPTAKLVSSGKTGKDLGAYRSTVGLQLK